MPEAIGFAICMGVGLGVILMAQLIFADSKKERIAHCIIAVVVFLLLLTFLLVRASQP